MHNKIRNSFEQFPVSIVIKSSGTRKFMVSLQANYRFGFCKYRQEKQLVLEGILLNISAGQRLLYKAKNIANQNNLRSAESDIFMQIGCFMSQDVIKVLLSPTSNDVQFISNAQEAKDNLCGTCAAIKRALCILNDNHRHYLDMYLFTLYMQDAIVTFTNSMSDIMKDILPYDDMENIPPSLSFSNLPWTSNISSLLLARSLLTVVGPLYQEEASLLSSALSHYKYSLFCLGFSGETTVFMTKQHNALEALSISKTAISNCISLLKKETNSSVYGINFILEYLNEVLNDIETRSWMLKDSIQYQLQTGR